MHEDHIEVKSAGELDDDLSRSVYAELYRLAQRGMRRQPVEHTLQPTALVNEAYLRLGDRLRDFNDRPHFLRVAARAMRQILVDHSRRQAAGRRIPRNRVTDIDPLFEALADDYDARAHDLIALDEALVKLQRVDPRLAALVELHFFGGVAMSECAHTLGVSERQVSRWWQTARAFLHREVAS
ncbi:MAG: ECF-type sigma factor [Planctomycetota bacterium]